MIIGTVAVATINDAYALSVLPDFETDPNSETDAIAEKKSAPLTNENFKKEVKAAFTAVSQTYSKFFFPMSKIAGKY